MPPFDGVDAASVVLDHRPVAAGRVAAPGSKLAGTRWVVERVAIEGCPGFSDDAAYRAMDFLLDALEEIAGEIFGSVATLLNLDLDIVFVDTTSTYWEVDVADELVDLAETVDTVETVDDDGVTRPTERGTRAFGHSKDHRQAGNGLPQVVIAMAVTRDGVPVRCWTFPGNAPDTAIIRDHPDREGRPRGLEPAPDGVGRRPWLRLGR
jgi:hypothetical protein